jgi:hypothetical protein
MPAPISTRNVSAEADGESGLGPRAHRYTRGNFLGFTICLSVRDFNQILDDARVCRFFSPA